MGLPDQAAARSLLMVAAYIVERLDPWPGDLLLPMCLRRSILQIVQLLKILPFEAPENINPEKVMLAARQAQIAEFIESSPRGYKTLVGERGIRLSGGQRQRIGIARALYKDASVLIFDEATSALDNATESALMKAIEVLSCELTIVMIAHRLSTVERCDRVIELENGVLINQGPPHEILCPKNKKD